MNKYEKIRGLLSETEKERRKTQLQSKLMSHLDMADIRASTPAGKRDPEAQRKLKAAQDLIKAVAGKHRQTKVRSGRHATQTDIKIAASTETNMNGYEKIVEMLGGGTPSHKAPGHKERMAAHRKRIQGDPQFTEPDPKAKARGAEGARKTNTSKLQNPATKETRELVQKEIPKRISRISKPSEK